MAPSKNGEEGSFLERKITLATEGFTTKFCELILRDRNRLSKENALVVAEYAVAMKREVNPRPSYLRYTIIPEGKFGLFSIDRSIGDRDEQSDLSRQKTKGAEAFELIIKESLSQSKDGVVTGSGIAEAEDKFGKFAADGSSINKKHVRY